MKWDSTQEPQNNSLNIAQFSSTHLGTFDRSVGMKPASSTSTLGASKELPPTAGTNPLPSPPSAHSMLMYVSFKVRGWSSIDWGICGNPITASGNPQKLPLVPGSCLFIHCKFGLVELHCMKDFENTVVQKSRDV